MKKLGVDGRGQGAGFAYDYLNRPNSMVSVPPASSAVGYSSSRKGTKERAAREVRLGAWANSSNPLSGALRRNEITRCHEIVSIFGTNAFTEIYLKRFDSAVSLDRGGHRLRNGEVK